MTHESGNLRVAQLKAPDADLFPQCVTLISNCHEQRFQGNREDAWRGVIGSYEYKLEVKRRTIGGRVVRHPCI